jgi:archaemetzincin
VKWQQRWSFYIIIALALALTAVSLWGAIRLMRFNTENRPEQAEVLLIIPLGVQGDAASMPTTRQLDDLAIDLQQTFALGVSIGEPMELSPALLMQSTGKLRVNLALSDLSSRTRKDDCYRVIGVTTRDIAVPKYNFLFGLAQSSGRACIVSTARLGKAGSAEARQRLAKLTIHEIGHTLGVMHSTDPASLMAYSNTLAELDATGARLTRDDMQAILSLHPELSGKLIGMPASTGAG